MNLVAAVSAGLLSSLAFEPIALWPFALLGLGIWYRLICRLQLKKRILSSYLYGLGVLLPTQIWTGVYVGNLPWLILCVGQALFFILPAFFVGRNKLNNQIAFVCSYIVVELALRTLPFTGFGWSRLGFTQVNSPLASIYPLFGVVGVSLILAWFATIRGLRDFFYPALVVLLAHFIPNPVTLSDTFRIALIQGGVVNLGLNFNDKPKEVFLRHVDQTRKSISAQQVNLIAWPENAVDVDVFKNEDVKQTIVDLSEELQTPILIGGVTSSPQPRNQSMLFNPQLAQVYTKRYLTPFGEYLPMRMLAEKISPYANDIKDFQAGNTPVVFQTNLTNFRALICYELLDDKFVRENTNDFLIIQTNNATFGDTAQLDQQLNIAQVRALESSRHIPYVSTTGITSLIEPSGQINKQLEKFIPATLVADIQKATGSTYAQKLSWIFEPGAIIILLLVLASRHRGRA